MKPGDQQPRLPDSIQATAWAPASLSNLGPGFDCLGLAISNWGDRISATQNQGQTVNICYHADSPWVGPTDPVINTAGVAATSVLNLLGIDRGVDLEILKGVVPGSGVGSSASSAVAAAWAVNLLHGSPLAKHDLVSAVLEGEAVAAGARHGDNALPSLFGGLVVASASDPAAYRHVGLNGSPFISIVLPRIEVLTRESRNMLSTSVPLRIAVENASYLALLVSAMQAGDWEQAGHFMMLDRLVEPVRVRKIPEFLAVRQAALQSGAFGCALSGSGPAIYALSGTETEAAHALEAMLAVVRSEGRLVDGVVTQVDVSGARRMDELEGR